MNDDNQGLSKAHQQKLPTRLRPERYEPPGLNDIQAAVIVHGPDGRILSCNARAQEMLGVQEEDLVGKNMARFAGMLFDADDAPLPVEAMPVSLVLSTGQPLSNFEMKISRPASRDFVWVLLSVTPVFAQDGGIERIIVTGMDITGYRKAVKQNVQTQRMQALEEFAGEFSEDFNDLLTAISGYADFLMEGFGFDDPRRQDLESIQAITGRGSGLIRQLLVFSRQAQVQLQTLDINELILNLIRMVDHPSGERITVTMPCKAECGWVKADPAQMEQVILNLTLNAREAMPEGGQLIFQTQCVEVEENSPTHHSGLRPGRYVRLSVSDTGCGMTEETAARIFEPFFSTKTGAKGLGLASVYGIIHQHGGHIEVETKPKAGTTFHIYLPATRERVQTDAGAQVPTLDLRGLETILVVEDDDAVRSLTRRILRHGGYKILEAADGSEAISICKQHDGMIHLLLADVVIPQGLTGRELAEQILRYHPESRVLFMSGYTDIALQEYGVLDPQFGFLGKPFTPSELLGKVREVLELTVV